MTVWFDQGPTGWRETGRDEHNVGEPLVAALTNRGRLADRYGRSELTPPLLSLSHAANKIATDMMVGAEFHMFPLRALFGVGPDDFKDMQGNRLSGIQMIMSRILTVPGGGKDAEPVTAHEFQSSSLTNFHDTIAQLGRLASGLVGVDPSVMGFAAGDNPASADALRAREVRLIKRAERKQRASAAAGNGPCNWSAGSRKATGTRRRSAWRRSGRTRPPRPGRRPQMPPPSWLPPP
jgi:hypothetical protein